MNFKQATVVKNSYTRYVALPPAWVYEHHLLPGDKIDLARDEDSSLVIRPAKKVIG